MWKLLFASVGVWQAGVMMAQNADRSKKYRLAKEHADKLKKPLLVVGGPWGARPYRALIKTPAHGCGDVCLDVYPEACGQCSDTVVADVREIPYPDQYFGAAFASHVLEHLPTLDDCERAVSELRRVADAVFVSSPSKQSIFAWLVPDHFLWVNQDRDNLTVEQRRAS